MVMTVAPPRVCVLMAGLSWGAMIAHAPQVCSPTQPESNQSDSGQGGCTTKLAEHIQAFLGKPGLLNTKLAIRVKRFHEAHLK